MRVHTTLAQTPTAVDLFSELPGETDHRTGHCAPCRTSWRHLQRVELAAGEMFNVAADEEVVCLLLSGQGRSGDQQLLSAPAALVAIATKAAFTATSAASLLCAHVTLQPGAVAARAISRGDHFDSHKLQWRDSIHGGGGRIATRHLWRREDFVSDSWVFVDHAMLAGGSSLGHHYHDFLEEAFVVLTGRGWMTIGDDTFDVGPGSVTYQAIGSGHGLYNPYAEELDFVRLAVGVPGESFTTVDLDDDLRDRQPEKS